MKKLLILLSTLALTAVGVWFFYRGSAAPESLVLGYSQEAPYVFVNDKAKIDGVFATAALQITQSLHITNVSWQLLDFFQLFGALKNKRISVIAAGLTVTPERAVEVCFAEPLLMAQSAIITLKRHQTDFAEGGRAIAVLANSVEHQLLERQGKSVMLVANVREGAIAVLEGRAIALALTKPALLAIMHDFDQQFSLMEDPALLSLTHLSSFALHNDNQDLLQLWNKAQRKLREQTEFVEQITAHGFSLPELDNAISGGCYAR